MNDEPPTPRAGRSTSRDTQSSHAPIYRPVAQMRTSQKLLVALAIVVGGGIATVVLFFALLSHRSGDLAKLKREPIASLLPPGAVETDRFEHASGGGLIGSESGAVIYRTLSNCPIECFEALIALLKADPNWTVSTNPSDDAEADFRRPDSGAVASIGRAAGGAVDIVLKI